MKFRLIAKNLLTGLFVGLAKVILTKYQPKIVVITGSIGKTSTKEALYTILRRFVSVRKNTIQGNNLGLALSIIGGDPEPKPLNYLQTIWKGINLVLLKAPYPKWLILELSVREPGDLRLITPWLTPDSVIVTYFGLMPPHIEFFKSREHLIDEKLKIIARLKKGGTVYLNADDPNFEYVKSKIKASIVTFGLTAGVNVLGSNVQTIYENDFPSGMNFKVNLEGHSLPVNIKGALGKNHVCAFLASVALASRERFNLIEASQAAENYSAPWGRMRLSLGKQGALIIDDSYNSSPKALEEALNTLRDIKTPGRKIAVLGDMLELGRDTYENHKQMGALAAKTANQLVTIGFRARGFGEGAAGLMPSGNIFEFEDPRQVINFLKNSIKPGDVILVKGSRIMHLEKIVEEIKAENYRG